MDSWVNTSPTVVVLQETLPAYRAVFFERLKAKAQDRDINVVLVHGVAPGPRGERLNTGRVADGICIRNRYIPFIGPNACLVWQPVFQVCRRADMIIVEQANRLLVNYLLLAWQYLGGPKVAFWGHGRNYQAEGRSFGERMKRQLAKFPSWWFAYTVRVAEYLITAGVDAERITVVPNAIDLGRLKDDVDAATASSPEEADVEHCCYIGGLYRHKRLEFLVAASDEVRRVLPGFSLTIAGDGELRDYVAKACATRPWLRFVGYSSGTAAARLLASSRLLLIPGLVGLVVLDSFAAGVPLVTTEDAQHSPEIEYLSDGDNALLLPKGTTPHQYAQAVIHLLKSPDKLERLREGARRSADAHDLDCTVDAFLQGISIALRS